MTITHVTALRNALADAVDAYLNTTGSADSVADVIFRDSTTTLVTIEFQNPAFGAASSGTITAAGVPLSGTASATGTADNFHIRDRDNAQAIAGTITVDSGGGDIELDNTSIASSQTVQLTALTYTASA